MPQMIKAKGLGMVMQIAQEYTGQSVIVKDGIYAGDIFISRFAYY